jgi:hypothetical protein
MMKTSRFISLSCTILTFTLLSSFTSVAEKSHQQKYEEALGEQMRVKCLVEYRGGGDAIHFVVGSFNTPSQAISFLHGRTFGKNDSKNQKTVYKVKECVEERGTFSSEKAKLLDKPSLR